MGTQPIGKPGWPLLDCERIDRQRADAVDAEGVERNGCSDLGIS